MATVSHPSFWLDLSGSPITMIEWLDVDDPVSIRLIHTANEQYLCNVQKDGTLLLEEDGCGDSVEYDYWLAPGCEMPETYGDVRQVELPVGSEVKKLIESAVFVNGIHHCQICQDSTYEDHYGASECGHLRYIEHLSGWGGCGYAEEDLTNDYARAFQALAQILENEPYTPSDTVATVIQWLHDRELQSIWNFTDRYNHYDCLEPALKYLDSLTKTVPHGYFDRAIAWLHQSTKLPLEQRPESVAV